MHPKVLVAPHAGLVYSGPIAGSAYAQLEAAEVRQVVILGPAHYVAIRGLAAPTAGAFATPVGEVPVDQDTIEELVQAGLVVRDDRPHREEHALEVQLPFLLSVLERFSIIPLVVGRATPRDIEAVLDRVWGGEETLIVISTDLSHYLAYSEATTLDRRTADAVEALNPEAIGSDQACGRLPLQAALAASRRRGLHAVTLDLRNSGDTAGPRDRVVGYGAFALA